MGLLMATFVVAEEGFSNEQKEKNKVRFNDVSSIDWIRSSTDDERQRVSNAVCP